MTPEPDESIALYRAFRKLPPERRALAVDLLLRLATYEFGPRPPKPLLKRDLRNAAARKAWREVAASDREGEGDVGQR